MLRSESKALGTWTIGALVMTAVIALAVPTGFAGLGHAVGLAAPSPGVSAPAPSHTAAVAHFSPSVRPLNGTPSPPINASANISTTFTGPQVLPTSIAWNISVTNITLNALNVSQTLLVMNGANVIANYSEPIMTNTTSYTATVDYGLLNSLNYGGGTLPTTPYSFTVWVTALNVSNGSVSWVNASSAPVGATLQVANAGVLFTSTLPLYTSLPVTINWTTTVGGNTGAVNDQNNTTINLELRFIESGCGSIFGLGAPCETVANETVVSAAASDFSSTGTYTYTISGGDFGAQNFANGQFPYGEYQVILWMTFFNSANPSQAPRTVSAAQYTYPVFDENSATFLSPSSVSGVTAGNVSISVAYIADFLSSANVTVYQGATGNTVVFSAGVFQAGNYAHAGAAVWSGATAGEYRVVLTIVTAAGAAAGASTFSELFNVTSAAAAGGGTVYYNQTLTIWNNQTKPVSQDLISGLGPGASAALLLVVGLIIGAIVALVLGRMMMGGQKPGSPQPWSGKGSNECNVCHQTFPSEAELKEHQKQAHGIG